MAGLINEEDIAEVRNRARIEDVVSSYVALRNAGSGTLKGLCPFHDEKTPSFQVTPARGFYYCFGCGESGDVITFVRKIANLAFAEAVEQLADKYGVQLRYTEGSGTREPVGTRLRILEANGLAAAFFADQLGTADALVARQFLAGRGFDRAAAEFFSVGFAPTSGRALGQHLKARGFTDTELVTAGLARQSGGWDVFQGRAVWPIKDAGGTVLGFGARRLFDDDRMPAKYINTAETAVYKKSHVLYGLDLARTNIGRKSQAVIVEGYTDVMAAHLSGVDTAVASCGTAFGDDHARLIQRLLGGDAFHGEVIFTFDGDEAGQKAAMKVFSGDRQFAAQTYVAVAPSGLDPCDLRLQQGEAAVRELVAMRRPLYSFVMGNLLKQFDLDRADGRLAALRATAPLVGSIRDTSLVAAYVRELAGMLGSDVEEVRAEVARAVRRRPGDERETLGERPVEVDDQPALLGYELPAPDDRRLTAERDTLKLVMQRPDAWPSGDAAWHGITPSDYTHPAYAALFSAVSPLEPPRTGDGWSHAVVDRLDDESLRQLAVQLSVEPLLVSVDAQYVREYAAKLRLLTVMRAITELKSKLQRTNPVTEAKAYNQMFSKVISLEARRRELLLVSTGEL